MKSLIAILMMGTFFCMDVSGQSIQPSIINSNGGYTTIGGNTYEWSIGEMVLVNTASAGSIVVTQGLLQPNKPSSGSAIQESQFIFDHVRVYPNPTDRLFFLSADFKKNGLMKCSLYDMNGKVIEDKEINNTSQTLQVPFDISALAAGNYMLVVSFTSNEQLGQVSKAAYKIEKTSN